MLDWTGMQCKLVGVYTAEQQKDFFLPNRGTCPVRRSVDPFEVRRRVRVKPNENVQSQRATPICPIRPELSPEVS